MYDSGLCAGPVVVYGGEEKVLRTHFLFSTMPMHQLLHVVNKMDRIEVDEGKLIVTEGEEDAKDFYIVASGAFDVTAMKRTEARHKGPRGETRGSSPVPCATHVRTCRMHAVAGGGHWALGHAAASWGRRVDLVRTAGRPA